MKSSGNGASSLSVPFMLFTFGALLLYSGWKGASLLDVGTGGQPSQTLVSPSSGGGGGDSSTGPASAGGGGGASSGGGGSVPSGVAPPPVDLSGANVVTYDTGSRSINTVSPGRRPTARNNGTLPATGVLARASMAQLKRFGYTKNAHGQLVPLGGADAAKARKAIG